MEEDPFELCVNLQPYQQAVSDGSVRHHNQGAFGWTIRNEQGQRVAAGMGPASKSAHIVSGRSVWHAFSFAVFDSNSRVYCHEFSMGWDYCN